MPSERSGGPAGPHVRMHAPQAWTRSASRRVAELSHLSQLVAPPRPEGVRIRPRGSRPSYSTHLASDGTIQSPIPLTMLVPCWCRGYNKNCWHCYGSGDRDDGTVTVEPDERTIGRDASGPVTLSVPRSLAAHTVRPW